MHPSTQRSVQSLTVLVGVGLIAYLLYRLEELSREVRALKQRPSEHDAAQSSVAALFGFSSGAALAPAARTSLNRKPAHRARLAPMPEEDEPPSSADESEREKDGENDGDDAPQEASSIVDVTDEVAARDEKEEE